MQDTAGGFTSSILLQDASPVAMLVAMKKLIKNSLLILILTITYSCYAALYKGLDAEGNVVYSDTPFEDAEKFTPPPISVVDTPKVKADDKAVEEELPAEFKYLSFDIVSPVNNQTIRNEPDVSVSLSLKPGLNKKERHSVWVLLDGKPIVRNSVSMSLRLGRLDRGAHKLQAQVRDSNGKIVIRTRTTLIHVHKTSAQ